MNPAITAALMAAALQEKSEEAIITRLRGAKALSASTAVPLDLDEAEQRHMDNAIAEGLVRRSAAGGFHLNEQAIAAGKEGQGFVVSVVVLIALSVIASGVALVLAFKS